MIFFLIFTLLTGLYGYALRILYIAEPLPSGNPLIQDMLTFVDRLPPIHRLFMAGLGCLWLSSLLEMLHYSIYAHNGLGDPLAHAIAQCLRVGAQLLMCLLLLLLAQGWSISTETLQHKWTISVLFVLFAASHVLLVFWAAGRDRASTLYGC